jgi:hypothetical protein
MNLKNNFYSITNQAIGSYVDYLSQLRAEELLLTLNNILIRETDLLDKNGSYLQKAISELDWAKINIDSLIESGRGGRGGVHGFIAEVADTGIRNAQRHFDGLRKIETWINDNGMADVKIGKTLYQTKFYNDIHDTLKEAFDYNISMQYPKDQYDLIIKIMNGETDIVFNGQELSSRKIQSIRELVERISAEKGVKFNEWAIPSELSYDDAQVGRIDYVLADRREQFAKESAQKEKDIRDNSNNQRDTAIKKSSPNLGDAHKAAGISAVIQGATSFGFSVYKNHKEGKRITEYTSADWKEVGVDTTKGAIKGGVSGYAIYGLSEVCGMATPAASSLVSGTFGLLSATNEYRSGRISDDEFIDSVFFCAADSTAVAIGAAIGQTLIPVPVLGAIIGSSLATITLRIGKNILNSHEEQLISDYQKQLKAHIESLDEKYRQIYYNIQSEFNEINSLQEYSFNLEVNVSLAVRFEASIHMAKKLGVDDSEILHDSYDIDGYFLD